MKESIECKLDIRTLSVSELPKAYVLELMKRANKLGMEGKRLIDIQSLPDLVRWETTFILTVETDEP